jgi:putative endonuclease
LNLWLERPVSNDGKVADFPSVRTGSSPPQNNQACHFKSIVTGLFCSMSYFVYIIQSKKDDRFYIGSTNNLTERIERHNQGRSRYTKGRGPWKLVYREEHIDRSSAVKREN